MVLGGLFVAEVFLVVIQVASFPSTGRRVFRKTPLDHHFEEKNWPESTLTIRFWLITAIACALGIALFHCEWVMTVGA